MSTTFHACAACKYQRRKCSSDCPLAPYFPADRPKQFLNVHRLFGVSNVLRILRQVNPSMKADAIKSIVYEADAWERDPVHGCLGLISLLQNQVESLRAALNHARNQIFLIEHNKEVDNLQSYAINPSLISTNPLYVHPSLPSSNHSSDYGSSTWANYADYQHEQLGLEGLGTFDGSHDITGEPINLFSGMHEHNQDVKIQVEEGVGQLAPNYTHIHEGVSSNRSDYSSYEGTFLVPNNKPNVTLSHDDDKEDLRTAAALFSLTGCK